MRKIKVVVLLVQQLQHGFTKNAKVSPNLAVARMCVSLHFSYYCALGTRRPLGAGCPTPRGFLPHVWGKTPLFDNYFN